MSRTGDGQEGRRDKRRLDPVQGHLVQVRRVHVTVVVPAEAIEGDEQHLGATRAQWCPQGAAAAGSQQEGEGEGERPQQHGWTGGFGETGGGLAQHQVSAAYLI